MFSYPCSATQSHQPFFWTKLGPAQPNPTVWDDLKEPTVNLDMKELEDIFTVDTSTVNKPSKSSRDTTKNQSLTTLLDITRANNVGKVNFDYQYRSLTFLVQPSCWQESSSTKVK